MKVNFLVSATNEFGIYHNKFTGELFDDAESTFLLFWRKMPKKISKNWISVEFEFDGKLIDVSRHHFFETNFDFYNSIDVYDK